MAPDQRRVDADGLTLPRVLVLVACLSTVAALVDGSATAAQGRFAALPTAIPAPPANPTTPERVALGRLLFWDPILSGQKDVACATCHHSLVEVDDVRKR